MKKFCALALCLLMTPIAAFAIPMSWHDELNFYTYLKKGYSHTYTHDINDDGFYAGSDWILGYKLLVGIRDDRDPYHKRKEKIKIDVPSYFGDRTYTSTFNASGVYGGGWSAAGWVSLNHYGLLDVTVKSLKGDFYLKSSKLWAKGYSHHDKPMDVPEPGSLALLGLGLVGLGLARRRLISKS